MLVFAATFTEETAGIVLLDSTHPDQFWRYPPEQAGGERKIKIFARVFGWAARLGLLRLVDGPRFLEADDLAADQQAALQMYFASARFSAGILAELAAFESQTFPQVRTIESLGDLPMVVMTAGSTAEQVPVQVALHQGFAALSTNSRYQVLPGASHARIVTGSDYLPEVHAAIRQVLDSASSGSPLAQE
jgi:pimeloyl-ACP methyl ester carboxylesterase